MKLDTKSKDKIIHISAIIFLICAIIIFIMVMFIVFEIDIEELIYGKEKFSITVENRYDETMKVKCYINGVKCQTETKSITIASDNSYTFKIEYIKSKKIYDIHIYAWNSSLSDFSYYIKDFYVYPEGKPFDLNAIINEDGKDITIKKTS